LSLFASVTDDTKPLFGIPLAAAVERSPCHDGILLPVVVRECIDYIEEFGK
jgi:RalA-binding protein 1